MATDKVINIARSSPRSFRTGDVVIVPLFGEACVNQVLGNQYVECFWNGIGGRFESFRFHQSLIRHHVAESLESSETSKENDLNPELSSQ